MSSTPAHVVDSHVPPRSSAAVAVEESTRRRRLIGLIVALGGLAVLSVAAWLNPSSDGLGTHEQLYLAPCGWIATMDMPCPTCGMTTAFAHAADGHLLSSFHAQPLGCILATGTAMAVVLGFYVAATGSALGGVLLKLWGRRTWWLIALLVLAAWGYKIITYRGLL
jgi:hypothetical protein